MDQDARERLARVVLRHLGRLLIDETDRDALRAPSGEGGHSSAALALQAELATLGHTLDGPALGWIDRLADTGETALLARVHARTLEGVRERTGAHVRYRPLFRHFPRRRPRRSGVPRAPRRRRMDEPHAGTSRTRASTCSPAGTSSTMRCSTSQTSAPAPSASARIRRSRSGSTTSRVPSRGARSASSPRCARASCARSPKRSSPSPPPCTPTRAPSWRRSTGRRPGVAPSPGPSA